MADASEASAAVIGATAPSCESINRLTRRVFTTRGGRIGSGMGILLEGLWGYFTNRVLASLESDAGSCEIGWIAGHEKNDFACVERGADWKPDTREGELFRVEAKSMNLGADESKGHFDELAKNIGENDLLVVLLWRWTPLDDVRVFPYVEDYFVGQALSIALLRDTLHLARGGSFVESGACPDGCGPGCGHVGEPINASGKRERKSGPEATRGANVSFAANFGGLVRMLKTNSAAAATELKRLRRSNAVIHEYVSFIHRALPNEEKNQYSTTDWRLVAEAASLSPNGMSKSELVDTIRNQVPSYQDLLRELE